jgi:uncharacterized protein (DUF362 family)
MTTPFDGIRTTRRALLGAAAAAGAAHLAGRLVPSALATPASAEVVWAERGSAGRLTRAAIDSLGGMGRFVKKGAFVVLKPNIGWDRTVEQAANTHPEIVAETAKMALEAGAKRVLIFDRTCNDARRCYVSSGIAKAVEGLGDKRVSLEFVDERRFREADVPGGVLLKRITIYGDLLDADVVINLPIAKHHSTAVLTLGLKNVMGAIGGNRAQLHRKIHEYLADLNRAIPSHLTVMDATRILVANGPQGGRIEDVRTPGVVIAGSDVVAVDAVTCPLFGRTPNEVGYIVAAQAAGLGVADLGRITVKRVTG